MEGVGARFGRSSNRYTPATVFTGPVRRWKKKWVRYSHHRHSSNNGTVKGANGSSQLLMYKWTPIAPSGNEDSRDDSDNNGSNSDNADSNKDVAVSADEHPKKKFKFLPVALLEAENKESLEPNKEEEAKPIEIDADTAETASKIDEHVEKPDINDVPMMDEIQASKDDKPAERHDPNKSTLDLSLGLKSHDSGNESDHEADQVSNDQKE